VTAIGLIGAALVALAGYSAGAVLAARGRGTVPAVGDLLFAPAAAALACVLALRLGRLPGVGAGVACALAAGALGEPLRARADRLRLPAHPADQEDATAWRRFSRRMGNFQGRLLLALAYFALVWPFALITRLRGDPLAARAGGGGTLWQPRAGEQPGLDAARRQS
jgi:hypothetical protein